MVIELRGVQFWSEIILVISNQTRAARSLDFEITRMISDLSIRIDEIFKVASLCEDVFPGWVNPQANVFIIALKQT